MIVMEMRDILIAFGLTLCSVQIGIAGVPKMDNPQLPPPHLNSDEEEVLLEKQIPDSKCFEKLRHDVANRLNGRVKNLSYSHSDNFGYMHRFSIEINSSCDSEACHKVIIRYVTWTTNCEEVTFATYPDEFVLPGK